MNFDPPDERAMLRHFRRILDLAERTLDRDAEGEKGDVPLREFSGPETPATAATPAAPATPATPATPAAPADALAAIEARVAFGDVDGALTALRARLEEAPDARGFTLLASIERKQDRLDEARRAADRAERLAFGQLARARCERARVLVDAGRMDEARREFAAAHEADAGEVDALVGLGSLALAAGEHAEAEARFRAALAREKSPRTLSGLGLALVSCGQARAALEPLEQALDLEADNVSAVYGMVQAAFQTGELQAAERRVAAYVALHAGNLDMAFTLAGLRQQLGDREGAAEMLERIELFDPGYAGLADLRAKLG